MTSKLPLGWLEVPLHQVADVRLGRQRSPDKATGEHMRPYMRAANVTWSGVDTSDIKQMNFSPNEFPTYELKNGDILLSEASGSASEVGKPAIWRNEIPGCCFQNTLIRVRSRGPLPEYLHLHFLADARSGKFATAGKGIGINHLGAERMSSWPVRLPPLNEQRRIVAKLEALQSRSRRAREALDTVPPLLEKLRQSILAAAFRGDLTKDWRDHHSDVEPSDTFRARIYTERRITWEASEFARLKAQGRDIQGDNWKAKWAEPPPLNPSNLPELPKGWCWTSIAQVAPLQPGFAFPSSRFVKQGIRLLKGINVRDGWLCSNELFHWDENDSDPYAQFRLSTGDIVLAMDRPVYSSGSRATKVARLDRSWEGALLLQRVGRFRPIRSLHGDYLLMFLQSLTFRDHLVKGQNGSQDGKDLPHVSSGVVDAALLPLPPHAEQAVLSQRVMRLLDSLKMAQDSVTSGLIQLESLEKAALAKAFRGELVPQDPSDEPAEALLARLRQDKSPAKKPTARRRRSEAAQ
jgi:type I restriction enzyme, S subunit